jgi:hypothetical protein
MKQKPQSLQEQRQLTLTRIRTAPSPSSHSLEACAAWEESFPFSPLPRETPVCPVLAYSGGGGAFLASCNLRARGDFFSVSVEREGGGRRSALLWGPARLQVVRLLPLLLSCSCDCDCYFLESCAPSCSPVRLL